MYTSEQSTYICVSLWNLLVAESCHAFVRDNSDDGIFYLDPTTLDLRISLIFSSEDNFLDFKSHIYAFTKPSGAKYNPGHNLILINEISTKIYWDESKRTPIFRHLYSKEEEEISPPMSLSTDLTSVSATRSCPITDDILLKMIERPDNVALVCHNVEVCHLISQTKHPEHKHNDGNIIYLSGLMHEHIDAINLE